MRWELLNGSKQQEKVTPICQNPGLRVKTGGKSSFLQRSNLPHPIIFCRAKRSAPLAWWLPYAAGRRGSQGLAEARLVGRVPVVAGREAGRRRQSLLQHPLLARRTVAPITRTALLEGGCYLGGARSTSGIFCGAFEELFAQGEACDA